MESVAGYNGVADTRAQARDGRGNPRHEQAVIEPPLTALSSVVLVQTHHRVRSADRPMRHRD